MTEILDPYAGGERAAQDAPAVFDGVKTSRYGALEHGVIAVEFHTPVKTAYAWA